MRMKEFIPYLLTKSIQGRKFLCRHLSLLKGHHVSNKKKYNDSCVTVASYYDYQLCVP